MFLKMYQLAIFTGVLFANIYWEMTPNGYLASLIAIGVSYMATQVLLWIVRLFSRTDAAISG